MALWDAEDRGPEKSVGSKARWVARAQLEREGGLELEVLGGMAVDGSWLFKVILARHFPFYFILNTIFTINLHNIDFSFKGMITVFPSPLS